jgi:hypothetical protein
MPRKCLRYAALQATWDIKSGWRSSASGRLELGSDQVMAMTCWRFAGSRWRSGAGYRARRIQRAARQRASPPRSPTMASRPAVCGRAGTAGRNARPRPALALACPRLPRRVVSMVSAAQIRRPRRALLVRAPHSPPRPPAPAAAVDRPCRRGKELSDEESFPGGCRLHRDCRLRGRADTDGAGGGRGAWAHPGGSTHVVWRPTACCQPMGARAGPGS